jgi:hypothetical protein
MKGRNRDPAILTSALDRDEWSASRSCRFTPKQQPTITHCTENLVDATAGLDFMKRKHLSPLSQKYNEVSGS